MVSTVAVIVATHNLAIGVVVGVLVAMVLFARRVAHLTETTRELVEDPTAGHGASTPSPASCSSPRATTSTPSSTTPTTPSTSSSTCPVPRLGRLDGRLARRDHDEVRRRGTTVGDRRAQRGQRRSGTSRLAGSLPSH